MIKPLTSDEVLDIISKHYHLDDIDYCMCLSRGFNDSYVLEVEGDKYIFRVYAEGKYYIAVSYTHLTLPTTPYV